MVKIRYMQRNNINFPTGTCNFHQTNTLKCTNVEFSVEMNTTKVFLLHEHTLKRRLRHLSVMRCSNPVQPYHNVVPFASPISELKCETLTSRGMHERSLS